MALSSFLPSIVATERVRFQHAALDVIRTLSRYLLQFEAERRRDGAGG